MKILIADDDPTSRLVMRNMLRGSGYDIVTAANGSEAVDCLSSGDAPRLALLDWMMPGLNGVDVCREIRRRQDPTYTYLVLLTSRDTKEDLVAGLHAGADDYIIKPCYPDEVRARLHTGERILRLEDSLIYARDEMEHRASHDALTDLLNRGAIVRELEIALRDAAITGETITVILGDVDHFKKINDTHGHPAGDDVLREISRRAIRAVSATAAEDARDVVGRFGGEEFLVVLRQSNALSAQQRAEALRTGIARSPIIARGVPLPVTMSLGAFTVAPGAVGHVDEALRAADDLLYQSKRTGRNRVAYGTAEGSGRTPIPMQASIADAFKPCLSMARNGIHLISSARKRLAAADASAHQLPPGKSA